MWGRAQGTNARVGGAYGGRDEAVDGEEGRHSSPWEVGAGQLCVQSARRGPASKRERAGLPGDNVLSGDRRHIVRDDQPPAYRLWMCHESGAMSVSASDGPHVPAG